MKTRLQSPQTYSIYVIELQPHLLENKRIAAANPEYQYRQDRPLLYVGMTGRSPEVRYQQHRDGYKASRYTRDNCIRLRTDLFEHLNPLTFDQASEREASYASELRGQGYAVWQN